MKQLFRAGLCLFVPSASIAVCQGTSSTPASNLVVHSGKTVNAKAVSWDDPVVVDGRVLRLRDLWMLPSVLSLSSSEEQNLRIPVMRTPVSSSPDSQPPQANQHCASVQAGSATSPGCSRPESSNPE